VPRDDALQEFAIELLEHAADDCIGSGVQRNAQLSECGRLDYGP
jgi:hypothetical protein